MSKYSKLKTRVEQLELTIMGYRDIYILPRDKSHLILQRADGTMVPVGENRGDFVLLGEVLEKLGAFKKEKKEKKEIGQIESGHERLDR